MNYYNPYFSMMPYNYTPTLATSSLSNATTSKGLLRSLFGGGKLSTFINGTQKTLNIINQAIPLVKQASPVIKNAKTMFKVMNEFKRVDNPTNNIITNTNNNIINEEIKVEENVSNINSSNNNGPIFFL